MKVLFTSVEDFKKATAEIAFHLKNTKLNVLREAVAKAHGFSSVPAYMDSLEKAEKASHGTAQQDTPYALEDTPLPNTELGGEDEPLDIMIRTKGLMDGCQSLEEVVAKCLDEADSLEALANAGAEIGEPDDGDGYVFVGASTPEQLAMYKNAYGNAERTHWNALEATPAKGTFRPEIRDYELVLRAKFLMEDQGSLTDIAASIRDFAEYLTELSNAGFVLSEPVKNDYAFVYSDDPKLAQRFGMRPS